MISPFDNKGQSSDVLRLTKRHFMVVLLIKK